MSGNGEFLKASEPKLRCSSEENLQLNAQFQHYRSQSYANVYHLFSQNQLSVSHVPISKSAEGVHYLHHIQHSINSDNNKLQISPSAGNLSNIPDKYRLKSSSFSAPVSPKYQQSLSKSKTLPHSYVMEPDENFPDVSSPKKRRGASLTNFLKRWSPKIKRSSSNVKTKPVIVVQFSNDDEQLLDEKVDAVVGEQSKAGPSSGREFGEVSFSTIASKEQIVKSPSKRSAIASTGPSSIRIQSPVKIVKEAISCRGKKPFVSQVFQACKKEHQTSSFIPEKRTYDTAEKPSTFFLHQEIQPAVVSSSFSSPTVTLEEADEEEKTNEDIPSNLETAPSPRLRRMQQPPRTLNILNKIVVKTPQMEKLASKIASLESIGSCSLDMDATASESSEGRYSSISQRTLRSASVMEIGYAASSQVALLPKSSAEASPRSDVRATVARSSQDFTTTTATTSALLDVPKETRPVSSSVGEGIESVSPRRQPSYVSISCSVSGYTSYSFYNSKAREELRSRDNSPARPSVNIEEDFSGKPNTAGNAEKKKSLQ